MAINFFQIHESDATEKREERLKNNPIFFTSFRFIPSAVAIWGSVPTLHMDLFLAGSSLDLDIQIKGGFRF